MKNVAEILSELEKGTPVRHVDKNSCSEIFTTCERFLAVWNTAAARHPEKFEVLKPKTKMFAFEVPDAQINGAKVTLWHKDVKKFGDSIRIPALDYERNMTKEEEIAKAKGLLVA